jgi:glycerol 2-dehydrogenase (NADP+)
MRFIYPGAAVGPDKTKNWLDTWKQMERVYRAHPDKLKAIGG